MNICATLTARKILSTPESHHTENTRQYPRYPPDTSRFALQVRFPDGCAAHRHLLSAQCPLVFLPPTLDIRR